MGCCAWWVRRASPSPSRRSLFSDAQKSVTGSVIGGRPAIREMLDFAARHGVAAKTQVRPLAEADAGLGQVRQGKARYRVVLAA